jgi:hypothetical protein
MRLGGGTWKLVIVEGLEKSGSSSPVQYYCASGLGVEICH